MKIGAQVPRKTENCSVLGVWVVSCTEVWSLNTLIASRVLYTQLQICLFLNFQGGSSMTGHWIGTQGKKPCILLPTQLLPDRFSLEQPFHSLRFGFSISQMEMKDLIFYSGFRPFHWLHQVPGLLGMLQSTLIPQLRGNLYVALGRPSPSNFLMRLHCKRFGLSLMKTA